MTRCPPTCRHGNDPACLLPRDDMQREDRIERMLDELVCDPEVLAGYVFADVDDTLRGPLAENTASMGQLAVRARYCLADKLLVALRAHLRHLAIERVDAADKRAAADVDRWGNVSGHGMHMRRVTGEGE